MYKNHIRCNVAKSTRAGAFRHVFHYPPGFAGAAATRQHLDGAQLPRPARVARPRAASFTYWLGYAALVLYGEASADGYGKPL